MVDGVQVLSPIPADAEGVLTDDALAFVANLHRRFNQRREELLPASSIDPRRDRGRSRCRFLPETQDVRLGDWKCRDPARLRRSPVEITGPTDRKMVINALNSGAKVFMADLEDALSPDLAERHRRPEAICTTPFAARSRSRIRTASAYELNDETATLVVRPRGWHLDERHVLVDGEPISASLFDFGLYFFHNAKELLARGSRSLFLSAEAGEPSRSAPLERRLHRRAGRARHPARHDPRDGADRDDLRPRSRWTRFSTNCASTCRRAQCRPLGLHLQPDQDMRDSPNHMLPDRAQVTMAVPFMRAYTRVAGQDLPQTRRARDRRHGGASSRARDDRRSTRSPSPR